METTKTITLTESDLEKLINALQREFFYAMSRNYELGEEKRKDPSCALANEYIMRDIYHDCEENRYLLNLLNGQNVK